jgi:hypothetical protein
MAKTKQRARYAVADGPALVKLMTRAGMGQMKVEIARDAIYRKAISDEEVATVDDVLDALRADSRVFPKSIETAERLAEFGEDYWDDEGNVVKENVRALPNIEDLFGKGANVKEAVKRLKQQATAAGYDPDLEPGGLDRTDTPALHSEDAQAEATRNAVGDAVSQEEAEARAKEARKLAADPPGGPATAGEVTGSPGTVTPKIIPPGTGQGSQEEANRAAAMKQGPAEAKAAEDDKNKGGRGPTGRR